MGKLYSLMGILPVTEADCIDALASAIMDYEDAVIERVAAKADMEYIVTRNRKDFQLGTVKAILPEELIKLMEQKK